MSNRVMLVLALFCLIANAQRTVITPRRVPGNPVCSAGANCFSGEVTAGEEFRKALNADLEFVLERGWTITIVPKRPEANCNEFADVVNAPYRVHRNLYINMTYGRTAQEETSDSPREFRFVTNCLDDRVESERLSIVLGYAGSKLGKIEWMRFTVEILLPRAER